MLDIFFLSFDEPNADRNYSALTARFPFAKRIHQVKGIANAHIAAARKSKTRFFYVVDADAIIHDNFDFSYKPQKGDEGFVHVWYAYNPVIDESYGYGGVKLFNKDFFNDVKTQVDFTMTLTKDIKVIEEISNTTEFNSDSQRAFRGAYREAAKLYKTINSDKSLSIRTEAEERLQKWLNPQACKYRDYIIYGVQCGIEESKKHEDIHFINDHALSLKLLRDRYAVDQITNPSLPKSHPMKQEFFFTNRIASSLYDPFVLENLPLTELRDAISDGQVLSKTWLAHQIEDLFKREKIKPQAKTAILGGWIGTLTLVFHSFDLPLEITSIDFDDRANRIAEKLNYDYLGFSTCATDMYEISYDNFDMIINTSSEHIPNIEEWRKLIPKDKVIVVQNNNFKEGDGHISCVQSSDELRELLKLEEVYYEGTRIFPQYERYMLIGRT